MRGHVQRRARDGAARPTTETRTEAGEPWREAVAGLTYDQAVQRLAPVQGQGDGDGAEVHAAAAHGTSGGGGALPHLAAIQRSFGVHDVSGVRAHVGGKAGEACASMGAQAYASGGAVAFGRRPDLHTAAHEAAHVVQQRAGVQLAGGVGRQGDAYERHADAVADLVVQGKSAESLLGRPSAGGGGRSGVQKKGAGTGDPSHRKSVGGTPYIKQAGDRSAVDVDDVKQQGLGDCWLMGTLAALAHSRPELVKGLVKEIPGKDGTYGVLLNGRWVSVTDELPVALHAYELQMNLLQSKRAELIAAGKHDKASALAGQIAAKRKQIEHLSPSVWDTVYASTSPGGGGTELWVALIEKAVAQKQGGYARIEGGDSADAFKMLTGTGSKTLSPSDKQLPGLLTKAQQKGWAVTATTRSENPSIFKYLSPTNNKRMAMVAHGRGISPNHCYAMRSFKNPTIALFDPRGRDNDPPAISIKDADFPMVFSHIDILMK